MKEKKKKRKKQHADEGSQLFWERLAEDVSTGICEHSSSRGPADLLFGFDKVRHRGSSALISFPTFTLVSSAGWVGGVEGEKTSPRQREVVERRFPRTSRNFRGYGGEEGRGRDHREKK